MKTKIIFITVILTIGFTFQNCCLNSPDETFFDIQDMSITHRVFFNDQAEDIVNYTLTLEFDVDYIVSQEEQGFNIGLMNSAYGFHPCPTYGVDGSRDEMFEDIAIITLTDFNETYLANDTITDLFTCHLDDWENRFSGQVSISEYLERNTLNVERENFKLQMTEAPTLSTDLQIRVRVDLSTGERYDAISDIVSFEQ